MIAPAALAASLYNTVNPGVMAIIAASIVVPVLLIAFTFRRRPWPPLSILLIESLYVAVDIASGFAGGVAPLANGAEGVALFLMAGPVVLAGMIVGFLWVPTASRGFCLDNAARNAP